MFTRFMNQTRLSKIIKNHRKEIKSGNQTAITAVIAAYHVQEAQGTFKHWPQYMTNQINSFYNECLDSLRNNIPEHEFAPEINRELSIIMSAVLQQAILCKDLDHDEVFGPDVDHDNLIKKLVNLKLLHERFLDDDVNLTTVA